jgi:hypothetical protein
MAKQGRRVLPARKQTPDRDTLLIRSAESLGRIIGSLQRQIYGANRGTSSNVGEAGNGAPRARGTRSTASTGSRKSAASRKSSKKR